MMSNHTGIVDAGYRGNLIGAFRWLAGGDAPEYTVAKHTRLLQICHPALCPIVVIMIKDETELSTTERNEGGFGSTGESGAVATTTDDTAEYDKLPDVASEVATELDETYDDMPELEPIDEDDAADPAVETPVAEVVPETPVAEVQEVVPETPVVETPVAAAETPDADVVPAEDAPVAENIDRV
jgi:hypothetical protein